MAHHTCFINMEWELPKKFLVMMLLAKAASSMETVIQMYSQLLRDVPVMKVESEMVPKKIIQMMRTAWETHGHAGMSWNNQQ